MYESIVDEINPFQIPPYPPFLKGGGTRRISILKDILPTHFHDEPKNVFDISFMKSRPDKGVYIEEAFLKG